MSYPSLDYSSNASARLLLSLLRLFFCRSLGPSLDAIPSYSVIEKAGIVYARLPETMELTVAPHYAKCKARSGRRTEGGETIAIVGGGAAAITAAETLRTEGYGGRKG